LIAAPNVKRSRGRLPHTSPLWPESPLDGLEERLRPVEFKGHMRTRRGVPPHDVFRVLGYRRPVLLSPPKEHLDFPDDLFRVPVRGGLVHSPEDACHPQASSEGCSARGRISHQVSRRFPRWWRTSWRLSSNLAGFIL